jgi:hypothetical protein
MIMQEGTRLKHASLWTTMLVLILGLGMRQASAQQIPGIIFDSDMSSDHDDAADLAVLHALADLGECNILACMASSQNGGTAVAFNSINTYFGRPNIPCGRRPDCGGPGEYPGIIMSEFPHPLYATYTDPPLCVNLYRQVLAAQPDKSVTIVTTGYMNNLMALMQSGADQYSSLNGMDLIKQKVKLLACAGGCYPEGDEFNFRVESVAANYVINNWPVQAFFDGYDVGQDIYSGGRLQDTPNANPIRRCFELTFFGPYPTWGQLMIYYAVRTPESQVLWKYNTTGRNTLYNNGDGNLGHNKWVASPDPSGDQEQGYMIEIQRYPIQQAIDTLVMNSGHPKSLGTVAPPNPPSNLRAFVVNGTQINLQWTDNSWNETGFTVEHKVNGTWTTVANVGAGVTSYSDTGLSSTANVSYRVKANNAIGSSDYATTVVYSDWTEYNLQTSTTPLYNYYQNNLNWIVGGVPCAHRVVNNDSNHGQDLTINVTVGADSTYGDLYVYFFYRDANNWYRLSAGQRPENSSKVSKFEKCVNGTITQIGNTGEPVNIGRGSYMQTWQVIVSHTGTLTFLSNNNLNGNAFSTLHTVLSVTDTLSFASGKIALGANYSAPVWDNFSFDTDVTNLPPPPPPPTTYALTVNSGSGSGNYTAGQTVTVTANAAPSGQQFASWTGATSALANATAATTTLTMPAAATTITATYSAIPNGGGGGGGGGTILVANGTYQITPKSSGLALSVNGSSAQQQTYTAATAQQWTLTNLGNNVVKLICVGNSQALEVPGASTTAGAMLGTAAESGATSQQWTLVAVGNGYYEIINVNSNLEANVAYNSMASGGNICQYTVGNVANGVWSFTAVGAPPPPPPTFALTVNNGTGGGNYAAGQTLTVTANAAPNGQQFAGWTGATEALANASAATTTLTMPAAATTITATFSAIPNSGGGGGGGAFLVPNGIYKITSQSSGLALAVNGSAAVQQTYSDAATQQWTVTNLGNNVVKLICQGNSQSLEVPGASSTAGTMLGTATYSGATHQQWTLVSVGAGYFEIINLNSNLEANVAYNSMASDGTICQWNVGNIPNGVWAFTPVSAPPPPTTYALTVNNGSGSGNYAGGQTVTVTANAAPSGQQFAGWTGATSALANASASTTTLTMPAAATSISVTYSTIPNGGGEGSFLISNGTYQITAKSSGLSLAVNGSAAVQQTYSGAASQQWTVNNLGNNVVQLTCLGNGQSLEAPGATTTAGAMLDTAVYSGAANQQWTLVSVGGGYYEIINANSNLEVNVAYNSMASGGTICQWVVGNVPNGVWAFTAVSGTTATKSLALKDAPAISSAASATPNPARTGQTVVFQAAADGGTLTYAWDFGDGTRADGASTTHVYTSAGNFTATLTMTDENGESLVSNVQVVVSDIIDLGIVALNKPFKIKLDVPAAGKLQWKASQKLPIGLKVQRSGCLVGRLKNAGSLTFTLQFKGIAATGARMYSLTCKP